jgi:hypothetical protein
MIFDLRLPMAGNGVTQATVGMDWRVFGNNPGAFGPVTGLPDARPTPGKRHGRVRPDRHAPTFGEKKRPGVKPGQSNREDAAS